MDFIRPAYHNIDFFLLDGVVRKFCIQEGCLQVMGFMVKEIKQYLAVVSLPLFFVSLVVFGITFTIVKAIILALAIIFLGRDISWKCYDGTFLLIVSFIGFYFLVSGIDSYNKTEYSPALLIMPAVLYAGGKWLGYCSRNGFDAYFSFFLIGSVMAMLPMLSILRDISLFGFDGGTRSIVYIGVEQEFSATVLGGMMILTVAFGGVAFSIAKQVGILSSGLVFIGFGLAVFSAARLGSRTLLLIALVSFLIGLLLNIVSKNNVRYYFYSVLLILIAIGLVFVGLEDFGLDNYFKDRIGTSDYGADTAGGRLFQWQDSLSLLAVSPLGWGIGEVGYAHNFWLDAARNGGWISFLFSLVLTLMFVRSLYDSIISNPGDSVYRTGALCVAVSFFMLFMVEPILDGFPYVFGVFCCFWGIVNSFRDRAIVIRN